jgi:uroporphyrinogen decarboxylase
MAFTPRERVLTALNHQEPDRVPLALWGSWYGVTDELYFRVLEEFKWQPVAPFRPDLIHSVNYYDDRLLEYLGVDVRHVDPGSTAFTSRISADGRDRWGLEWDTSGLYRTANRHPLQEATIDDLEKQTFPDAELAINTDQIIKRLEAIRALPQKYAVVGRAVESYGFFEMAQSLRKHDVLLMDLALNPDFVHALIDRLFNSYAAMITRFLDVAGEHLDMLELPGDDFAGNRQPIISIEMFDQFFKEPYRRMVTLVKTHSPHIKVVYHSDGAITPFLSRLVEIGFDVIHPLEPLPATDFEKVKADYGRQLVFMGGIDIREALQGSQQQVEQEVCTRLKQMARGGGYIMAPANHLQWDIPLRNLFTLYEAAQKYGIYPLTM